MVNTKTIFILLLTGAMVLGFSLLGKTIDELSDMNDGRFDNGLVGCNYEVE